MKKAIKINISGVIFHIDEDAYDKLEGYLKSVELYFRNKDGGKEIIDDIETRIAELFQMRVTDKKKEVITIDDVTEVTAIMGDPSDFVEEAEDPAEDKEASSGETKRTVRRGGKRLYRDPDNSVFGGVCGGLGAYFGIDPVIFRILFVVLLIAGYGVWGLVYIVLWIAIPKAISIAQKLEMRGEHITVSSIEKTVRQEYEDVKTNFKKFEKSEGYKQATSAFEEIFQVLGRILLVIAKVVLILLGVAFVFLGFILLMSFLGLFFFNTTLFSFGWFSGSIFPLSDFLSAFIDPVNLSIMLVALFFTILIPLISIIYGGIKLIFQIRSKDHGIGVIALILWIASISVLLSMGFIESRKYVFKGEEKEHAGLVATESETLYLQLNETADISALEDLTWVNWPEYTVTRKRRVHHPGILFRPWFSRTYTRVYEIEGPNGAYTAGSLPGHGLYSEPEKNMFYSRPALVIGHTSASVPELIVEKRARGSSPLYAERNAGAIVFNWSQTDSLLVFDNLLTSGTGQQWNFAEVTMRLNIPEGYHVNIGDRMDRIITSARNTEGKRVSSMTGKKWEMTRNGLTLQPADR